ncbi:MAG: hypothetical protein GF401_07750 [Chitinivibrionales bacterium]|nr:hypothetical protein [Chitinivibrionales bacterium]
MFVRQIWRFMLIAGSAGILFSLQAGPKNEKPVVYTTFYPTQYFTQRIGGNDVAVVNPVPENEDPIFWLPPREIIRKYHNADLIVLNGAGFEEWVDMVTLPREKVVVTASPLKNEFITYEKAVTHSHGPGGEHAHEGLDGHTWLDPVYAKVQAERIQEALIELLPEKKETLAGRFRSLIDDLDNLDKKLKALGKNEIPLLMSHPAYNYIARRYKWSIINLDLDPEKMPSHEHVKDIATIVSKTHARYLVWEGPPEENVKKHISEKCGLTSILFSPCELLGRKEREKGLDYMKIMNRNIENISNAFN